MDTRAQVPRPGACVCASALVTAPPNPLLHQRPHSPVPPSPQWTPRTCLRPRFRPSPACTHAPRHRPSPQWATRRLTVTGQPTHYCLAATCFHRVMTCTTKLRSHMYPVFVSNVNVGRCYGLLLRWLWWGVVVVSSKVLWTTDSSPIALHCVPTDGGLRKLRAAVDNASSQHQLSTAIFLADKLVRWGRVWAAASCFPPALQPAF